MFGLGNCAVCLGLEITDRAGAGAGDGALGAVGEVDGDGVFGDVGGDHGPGLITSERDELAGDHDGAGGRDPAGDGDRLDRRAWWWSGGSGAAQVAGLVVGQRVRSGAQ